MQFEYLLKFAIVLAVIATMSRSVQARRLKLRPLSADEVYRILKEVGREDAVPEGRVVSQGIAAMTGFALGVTKGIGGSLLFDLATSNMTGLFSFGNSANTTSSGTTYQTQEICFNSRSMEPGLQSRNANDKYGLLATSTATSATTTPTTAATSPTTGDTTTGAGTTTGTATGTDTGTNVDTGTETTSDTGTETDTGTGSGQTCIVIQKPKVRKRRSSQRRRRH